MTPGWETGKRTCKIPSNIWRRSCGEIVISLTNGSRCKRGVSCLVWKSDSWSVIHWTANSCILSVWSCCLGCECKIIPTLRIDSMGCVKYGASDQSYQNHPSWHSLSDMDRHRSRRHSADRDIRNQRARDVLAFVLHLHIDPVHSRTKVCVLISYVTIS